jgi:hypothetical protein
MSAVAEEIRIVSPTSILGAGFRADSFERAMEWKPDVIACDGGSTDPGPYFLGSGELYFSRDSIKRDLELMLLAARAADIPLLIGTAVGAGTDVQLAVAVEVAQETASPIASTSRSASAPARSRRSPTRPRSTRARSIAASESSRWPASSPTRRRSKPAPTSS